MLTHDLPPCPSEPGEPQQLGRDGRGVDGGLGAQLRVGLDLAGQLGADVPGQVGDRGDDPALPDVDRDDEPGPRVGAVAAGRAARLGVGARIAVELDDQPLADQPVAGGVDRRPGQPRDRHEVLGGAGVERAHGVVDGGGVDEPDLSRRRCAHATGHPDSLLRNSEARAYYIVSALLDPGAPRAGARRFAFRPGTSQHGPGEALGEGRLSGPGRESRRSRLWCRPSISSCRSSRRSGG